MKAQTQWTIICFSYWKYLRHSCISAIHSTLQYYCYRCFWDLIICVHFFGIHRVSLWKNRYPYKDNFHLLFILDFYSSRKTRTRCYSKILGFIILHVDKISRLVQHFASLWYFVISSSSFDVFYLQIYMYKEV